jgi:hypothetical protein
MRRFSQLTTGILMIWQRWFEIARERFNSSVGTNTCQRKCSNSSFTPMTRLLVRRMKSGSSFQIFAPSIPSTPLKFHRIQRHILVRQHNASLLLRLLESLNRSSGVNSSCSRSRARDRHRISSNPSIDNVPLSISPLSLSGIVRRSIPVTTESRRRRRGAR